MIHHLGFVSFRARVTSVSVLALIAGSAVASEPPSFRGLGGLHSAPDTGAVVSSATGVSADGSTVVGSSADSRGRIRPFHWRLSEGMVALGEIAGGAPADYHDVGGTSADGAVTVGTAWSPSSCPTAARWSGGAAPSLLASSTCMSAAYAVSADGGTVVGDLYTQPAALAMAWNITSGAATVLGVPASFREVAARGISNDGVSIVGTAFGAPGSQALVWENGGIIPRVLGYLPNTERVKTGRGSAISPDGTNIVGQSSSSAAGDGGIEGFIYRMPAGPMLGLGPAGGGQHTAPMDVCNRGEVVVGSTYIQVPPFTQSAFIWTRETGLRDLKTVLQTVHGLDLSAWHLSVATGISADGSVIVGTGTGPHGTEAWRAVIPPIPEPCIADFNQDGGVDGTDVAFFYMAWSESDPSADANQDGGVDGSDVESFFVPWEAGGC